MPMSDLGPIEKDFVDSSVESIPISEDEVDEADVSESTSSEETSGTASFLDWFKGLFTTIFGTNN
jgi:hypothetical protein